MSTLLSKLLASAPSARICATITSSAPRDSSRRSFERDRTWLDAHRQAILRRPALHGIDPQRQAQAARPDRARDRGLKRRRALRARLLLGRDREVAFPVTDLDSRAFHFHLDPVEASVPDLVRRIVPEHVRHARIVGRAPDRALDVVGVQEGPTARILGRALEDVLVLGHHRERREGLLAWHAKECGDQPARIHGIERDVRIVQRPRRAVDFAGLRSPTVAERLQGEGRRDPDQVLAVLDARQMAADRLEGVDGRHGAHAPEVFHHRRPGGLSRCAPEQVCELGVEPRAIFLARERDGNVPAEPRDGANERARIAGEIVSDAQQPVAAQDVESDAIVGPDLLQEPGDMFPDIHAHDRRRVQLVVENDRHAAGVRHLVGELARVPRRRGRGGRRGAASLDREQLHLLRLPIVLDLKIAGGQSGNRIPVPVRDDDAQLDEPGARAEGRTILPSCLDERRAQHGEGCCDPDHALERPLKERNSVVLLGRHPTRV